jgi:hypothetical protein
LPSIHVVAVVDRSVKAIGVFTDDHLAEVESKIGVVATFKICDHTLGGISVGFKGIFAGAFVLCGSPA